MSQAKDSNAKLKKSLSILQKQAFSVSFNLKGYPYKAIETIGTGAYGVVCSAVNTETGVKVAIKKIANALHNPTVAKRSLREVRILRQFNHGNIISITDMLYQAGNIGTDIYIVFDLMETDLHHIIHSNQALSSKHVQYFLYQILRGLRYIHEAGIIHRDLKPSNIMVNANCTLKIGDFGMARVLATSQSNDVGGDSKVLPPERQQPQFDGLMTQYVATRWYRAPELLFSLLDYGPAVDLWSTGCVFAEMVNRRQLFAAKDNLSQLKMIIYYLGSPPPEMMQCIQSELVQRIIKVEQMSKEEIVKTLLEEIKGYRPSAKEDEFVDEITKKAILVEKKRTQDELRKLERKDSQRDSVQEKVHRVSELHNEVDMLSAKIQDDLAFRSNNATATTTEVMMDVSSSNLVPPPTKCASTQRESGEETLESTSHQDVEVERSDQLTLTDDAASNDFNDFNTSEMVTEEPEQPTTSGIAAEAKLKLRAALVQAIEARKKGGGGAGLGGGGGQPQVQPRPTAQSRYQEKLSKKRQKRATSKQEPPIVDLQNNPEFTAVSDRNLLDRWSKMAPRKLAPPTQEGGGQNSSSVPQFQYGTPPPGFQGVKVDARNPDMVHASDSLLYRDPPVGAQKTGFVGEKRLIGYKPFVESVADQQLAAVSQKQARMKEGGDLAFISVPHLLRSSSAPHGPDLGLKTFDVTAGMSDYYFPPKNNRNFRNVEMSMHNTDPTTSEALAYSEAYRPQQIIPDQDCNRNSANLPGLSVTSCPTNNRVEDATAQSLGFVPGSLIVPTPGIVAQPVTVSPTTAMDSGNGLGMAQLGEIISQSLPSPLTLVSSENSARLLEDWRTATSMRSADMEAVEREMWGSPA